MTHNLSTLIVGSVFRRLGGQILMQRRSWQMARMFGDHMASPTFVMHESPSDNTLTYEIPQRVRTIALPLTRGKRMLLDTLLCKPLNADLRAAIDSCHAVHLREPLWACWGIYRYARYKRKKIIASFHGDWVEGLRSTGGRPIKRVCNAALSLYVEHTLRTIARHSELLLCVGQSLADKYGRMAKECVVFANFQHSEKGHCTTPRDSY